MNDRQRRALGLDRESAATAVLEEQAQAIAYETWVQDEIDSAERSEAGLANAVMPKLMASFDPVRKPSVAPVDSRDPGLAVPTLRAAPRKLYTGFRAPRDRVRTTVYYYYKCA